MSVRYWAWRLRRWFGPAHLPGFLFYRRGALVFKCVRCGHVVPAEVTGRVYRRWYSGPCPGCGLRYMSEPVSERAPNVPVLKAGDHVTIWGQE